MEPITYRDTSNRSSRSQLSRLSRQSQTGSPGDRWGTSRIAKPNGSCQSPYGMQRRRTTASQSSRTNHAIRQEYAALTHGSGVPNPYCGLPNTRPTRPVSWHPGFSASGDTVLRENGVDSHSTHPNCQGNMPAARQLSAAESSTSILPLSKRKSAVSSKSNQPNAEAPFSDGILGNTIAGFETLAVSGSNRQSLESDIHRTASQNQYPLNQSQHRCEQTYDAEANYGYFEPIPVTTHSQHQNDYPSYEYQLQAMSYQSSCDPYVLPQNYVLPSDNYTFYGASTSPSFLPIQYPPVFPQADSAAAPPPRTTKKNKELVGMGLYDDKNGSMFAPLDQIGSGTLGLGDSLGKGLKLEETWKPPGEADEADEGYSTDDAEEELPIALGPQEARLQVLPADGDLSNQTFFFDNDEQYGNFIAYHQGLSAYPSKPIDPAAGDFLWF